MKKSAPYILGIALLFIVSAFAHDVGRRTKSAVAYLMGEPACACGSHDIDYVRFPSPMADHSVAGYRGTCQVCGRVRETADLNWDRPESVVAAWLGDDQPVASTSQK